MEARLTQVEMDTEVAARGGLTVREGAANALRRPGRQDLIRLAS